MKRKNIFWSAGIIAVLIAIFIVCFFRTSWPINEDGWQAVFLTNNQVYFGKIDNMNKDYIKLTKVFYLQSDQGLGDVQKDATNLNLIKLGAEIHGPEDVMFIAKNQIIFWENLKSNSRVVNIINNYK